MNEYTLRLLEVYGVWVGGIATLVAVLLAISIESIRRRRSRPKLEVYYERDDEDDNPYLQPEVFTKAPYAQEEAWRNREEQWIRVRVVNTGRSTARDVQLRLVSIKRETAPTAQNRPHWWFKVSNLNELSISIPPKFTQYFDIAYVSHETDEPNGLKFYLATVRGELLPWPQQKRPIEEEDRSNWLEIGWTYKIRLAAVSDNADARNYELEIKALPSIGKKGDKGQTLGRSRLQDLVHVVELSKVKP